MSDLSTALQIAAKAHGGQTRADGSPYILHPIRVMMAQNSEEAMITAVLHDVVEDTEITLDDLRKAGFDKEILEALTLLTHTDEDSYGEYVGQVARNALACQVKIADLEDNLNLREIPKLRQHHLDRAAKYHRAWRRLKAVSDLGLDEDEDEDCPQTS